MNKEKKENTLSAEKKSKEDLDRGKKKENKILTKEKRKQTRSRPRKKEDLAFFSCINFHLRNQE